MNFNPDFQFDDSVQQSSHPWNFAGALAKASTDGVSTSIDDKVQRRLERDTVVPSRPQVDESEDDESDDNLPGEVDDGDDELDVSEDEYEWDDSVSGDACVEGQEGNVLAPQLTEFVPQGRSQVQRSKPSQGQRVVKSQQRAAPMKEEEPGGSDGEEELDDSGTSFDDADDEDEKVSCDEEDDLEDDPVVQDNDEELQNSKGSMKGIVGKQQGTEQGDKQFYSSTPKSTKFSAHTFASLGLSRPLLKSVSRLGYTVPTPIQAAVVPLALAGRDIVASAITGSGKTAAFALPLLERLLFRTRTVAATHVLVLCPTRELAAQVQVHSMICQLAEHTDIRAALVMGGLSLSQQATELRQAPEIVVATPGRIIDHVMNTMAFELDTLSALVLDEADRLLEMGFQDELQQILKLTPSKRQTLLFSATMSTGVQQLIQLSLTRPVRLAADATAATPATLRQEVVRLKGGAAAADKAAVLCALCARALKGLRTIIFCREKRHAHWLKVLLGLAQLAPASELHGDMTQAARLQALEDFRTGKSGILIATDVAARGLDILGVQAVVNYNCPRTLATYLHRVGRTARAGAKGLAVSFVEDKDRLLVKAIMKDACKKLEKRELPKCVIEAWRKKVEALSGSVEDVLMEEKQEKAFRLAEMEATKAGNIIKHHAEILSRPKREWFMSTTQKKAASKAAAEHERSTGLPVHEKKERDEKRSNGQQKGEAQSKPREHAHVTGTRHVIGSVKAAKAAARGFRESGAKPREAAKAALTATGAAKREKQKPKRKQPDCHSQPDDGPSSKAPKNARVYAGGGKSGSVTASKTGPSKADRARIQRGGKGKGQFKGKARYKRK